MNRVRLKVTFEEHFDVELVEALRATAMVGLAETSAEDNPRVLYLNPPAEKYAALKAQLEELQKEGALSYVEVA